MIDTSLSNLLPSILISKDDHKRSRSFRGDVVVPQRKIKGLLKSVKKECQKYSDFRLPIPYLPSHERKFG